MNEKLYSDSDGIVKLDENELDFKFTYPVDETISRNLQDIRDEIASHKGEFTALREEIKPVMEWFSHMNWAKKSFMWVLGLIVSISAAPPTYTNFSSDQILSNPISAKKTGFSTVLL